MWGSQPPWCAPPRLNVAMLGYDVGKISVGCLVLLIYCLVTKQTKHTCKLHFKFTSNLRLLTEDANCHAKLKYITHKYTSTTLPEM